MSNKTVNTLACLFGLAAAAAGVEANRTDADATAIRPDAGWAPAMEGTVRPACGRVRWRGGAEAADAYPADGQPGCFADVLRELAGNMGRIDAPTVPAGSRSAPAATVVASTASNDEVDIPDAGLREALAEELGKQPDEAITTDEMAKLTRLAATDRGIVDLAGLRHATNLRELELDRNAIVDISEVGELSALARLSLDGNGVADLWPLAGLKGLRSLSLARNGLAGVEDLATMDGLETLDLAGNELADLWPLNLLTGLRDLALDDNQISNLAPLFDLQALETLTLAGNQIESVEELAALAGLRTLSLADNRIADIWFLSGLTSVERLSLRGNEIADISPLAGLTELAQLWLGSNQLTDISPLSGLGGLVLLDLERNRIADVGPLAALTNLVGLGLGDNDIADAEAVSALVELTALDLGGNNLADAPPLAGLQNLKTLWLHGNAMADIAALASLDSLARLELGDNDIVDIGPLAGLADLATLGLAGNAIEDVGALASLDKLVWLSLDDNNLSDLAPLSALTELAALRASFNELADIAPLADLKSLQRLMLHDNRISDLSALAGLADLKVLGLGANVVADVSALEDLAELRQLILAENNIRDVSPLAGLTKLTILALGENQVADVGPLAGLRDMRVLDLEDNGISDLGDVGRLTNLWVLGLANNDVSDIGSLVDNPGMGPGDLVDLRQNPLDALALGHVEDLRVRGVRVLADGPDIVAESASVSDASPDPGGSFTLSATVRNAGAGAAAATTLRYYRSDDALIDAADTEVGTDAVPELAAGDQSVESIVLTAPSSAGTYYYGACVDSVTGESDTGNNCSTGVQVDVGDGDGKPDAPGDQRYVRDGTTTVVSWDAVSDADHYTVYHDDFWASSCTLSGGRPTYCEELATDIVGTSYTHTTPDDDDNYYWVVACNAGGCSDIDSGNPARFIDTRPGTPDNQRYVWQGSNTVLSWDAASDADDYTVYYDHFWASSCTLSGGRPTYCEELATDIQGTSYTHTTPDDDDNYYWVVACNAGGCSDIDSQNPAVLDEGGGSDAPDLLVESPAVDDTTPDPGGSIGLSATVRNGGGAGSDATTLRYYRSSNSAVSSSDTEVGTDPVAALGAGATSNESITLTAPSTSGTYYFGACVDSVSGESDTANNCSNGVEIVVGGDAGTAPDLVVESPSVDDDTPETGDTITLSATVRNRGDGASGTTTLRYYRSSNATISSSDTEVGTDAVGGLAAGANSAESISLTAPSDAGTYYYGACVDSVSGESDTANNCSNGVEVVVGGDAGTAPDLVVESPSVDDDTPETGDTIMLSATVRNRGDGASGTTTLRYYRSSNATISSSDTEVGTDAVAGLAAGASSAESISLTAPSDAGTYYYGACVDSVSGESDTGNNCSDGVQVEVSNGGGGNPYCRDDDVIEPGDRCDIYDTSYYFEVLESGRACTDVVRLLGFPSCSSGTLRVRRDDTRIEASSNGDKSWTIDDVEPEPDD